MPAPGQTRAFFAGQGKPLLAFLHVAAPLAESGEHCTATKEAVATRWSDTAKLGKLISQAPDSVTADIFDGVLVTLTQALRSCLRGLDSSRDRQQLAKAIEIAKQRVKQAAP